MAERLAEDLLVVHVEIDFAESGGDLHSDREDAQERGVGRQTVQVDRRALPLRQFLQFLERRRRGCRLRRRRPSRETVPPPDAILRSS